MPGENIWCRPKFAKAINDLPGTRWIPNRNASFATGGISQEGSYESGLPDGFVISGGRVICCECKAFFGSVQLGSTDEAVSGLGWSAAQRNWWRHNALYTHTPYYIPLWVYGSREQPARVYQKDAQFFVVPVHRWMELETAANELGTRTVPLNEEVAGTRQRRLWSVTIDKWFADYALTLEGSDWRIPDQHAFRNDLFNTENIYA